MFTRRTLLRGAATLPPAMLASCATAAAGPGDAGAWLNAATLGLSPGSPDDQSATFRAGMEQAEATGLPLFLPPGYYVLSAIDLPERAHIVGVPGETVIVFGGGSHLFRAPGGRRLRLEGLTVDGRGIAPERAVGGLIAARDVADVAIRDCVVRASGRSGIRLDACAGRIHETKVAECAAVGIHLVGSRGFAVLDSVVEAAGNTGILVQRHDRGADDTIVRGNRITNVSARSGGTGQFGNGINIAQADGAIVSGNRIADCTFSAVRVFSSANVSVSGNTATRCGEVALYVEFAHEGAVVSDNIVEDAGIGISLANFMEHGGRLSVCSGNLIRNLRPAETVAAGRRRYGIGISAEADAALTGNVVENAPLCAFQLGWGPYLRDVAATGNVVRNTGIGFAVSVVEGAGATLIADNLVSGAGRGAVRGMRWADPVTGDLADGGAERFAHLTIARNRVQ